LVTGTEAGGATTVGDKLVVATPSVGVWAAADPHSVRNAVRSKIERPPKGARGRFILFVILPRYSQTQRMNEAPNLLWVWVPYKENHAIL
jgi:hypothetical protein